MNWKRSSRCNFEQPQCVEVGRAGLSILVKDSKRGDRGPVLEVAPAAWRMFLRQF